MMDKYLSNVITLMWSKLNNENAELTFDSLTDFLGQNLDA